MAAKGEEKPEKKKLLTLSADKEINLMLNNVVAELSAYADEQRSRIKSLIEIGIALSAEKDLSLLLEMIVDDARRFTNADGGTLYLADEDELFLHYEIVQSDSMSIRMGGKSSSPIDWPPVPLKLEDGTPNMGNVSAAVALTKSSVNIADVYETEEFDFTGPRKFDEQTGYRTKSMLVIPMLNHENEIIGVLQLINAQLHDTDELIAFQDDLVDLTSALASQAAVAITNVRLIKELETLFDSFIQTIATAIDEKSPYTAGHISRVANLTMDMANMINEVKKGQYKDVNLSDDELNELRLAAWMHDVGKIATPEHVVDKHTKLEKVFDRVELIRTRFELIKGITYAEWCDKRSALISNGKNSPARLKSLDEKYETKLNEIIEDAAFCIKCNEPGEFMEDEKIEKLERIAKTRYKLNGSTHRYLDADEVLNLSIRRGTLNVEDRKIIENHAMITLKMLKKLPFGKKLRHVPEYAAAHHEKLDGSGYPLGLKADEISLQSRLMAIADVFEALTARDRPYKKPMMLSQAIRILGFMAKDLHLDPELLDVFLSSGLAEKYAKKNLSPKQIDWKTSDINKKKS